MSDSSGSDDANRLRQGVAGVVELAGTALGLTALVYAVGGAVMWLRLDVAGLPAATAMTIVPGPKLFVEGFKAIWDVGLGLISSYVVIGLVIRSYQRAEGVPGWAAPIEWARVHVLCPVFTGGPSRRYAWLGVLAVAVLALPSYGFAAFALVLALLPTYVRWVRDRYPGQSPFRTPLSLVLIVSIAVASSIMTIGSEADPPATLDRGIVVRTDGSRVDGAALDAGPEGVTIGVIEDHDLELVPNAVISETIFTLEPLEVDADESPLIVRIGKLLS